MEFQCDWPMCVCVWSLGEWGSLPGYENYLLHSSLESMNFCILSGLRAGPIYEEKISNLIHVLLRHINGPLQMYKYPFYGS